MSFQLILPGLKDPIEYQDVLEEGRDTFKFTTVGGVISEALKYLFPLAGLILFFILISAGFNMLTAAGNEEKVKKAHAQLTAGLIGFIILVISFWLVTILETVLGIKIF